MTGWWRAWRLKGLLGPTCSHIEPYLRWTRELHEQSEFDPENKKKEEPKGEMESMTVPLMASWFLFPQGHLRLYPCPDPDRIPQDPILTLGRRNSLETGKQEEAGEGGATQVGAGRAPCGVAPHLLPTSGCFSLPSAIRL